MNSMTQSSSTDMSVITTLTEQMTALLLVSNPKDKQLQRESDEAEKAAQVFKNLMIQIFQMLKDQNDRLTQQEVALTSTLKQLPQIYSEKMKAVESSVAALEAESRENRSKIEKARAELEQRKKAIEEAKAKLPDLRQADQELEEKRRKQLTDIKNGIAIKQHEQAVRKFQIRMDEIMRRNH